MFYKKKNVVTTKVDVQVKTLDSVYMGLQNRFGFRRPYLKIDTQGYELEVVRGGEMALREILALQTEASVLPIYHDIPDYRTVISELEDRGFQLSGIFSCNSIGAWVLVNFDCIMTRR